MADVHVTPIPGTSIVFHNPAQHPLPASAGKTITPAVKTPGNPNGATHGQVPNTSIVHDNPA
ncbi:MAG: hypothetical protein DMG49_21580 [Acidobacteria bacterium]|nr:MAG: hypothetical protein DMG49_21580 [Acidobacteriota bacterium]